MVTFEIEIPELVKGLAQASVTDLCEVLVDAFDTGDLLVEILEQYSHEMQLELLQDVMKRMYLTSHEIMGFVDNLSTDEDLIEAIIQVTDKRLLRADLKEALEVEA